MSAYHLRLQTLLRLRRAQEAESRLAVMITNERLRGAIAHRDSETRRLAALSRSTAILSAESLLGELKQEELIASSILVARDAVNSALTTAALAQVAWHRASRDLEALERLNATRRAEHSAEEARIEALENDDIATASYRRQGRFDTTPSS